MHFGPIAILRMYWSRLHPALRAVAAAGLLALGLALHVTVISVLGALLLAASAVLAIRRVVMRWHQRETTGHRPASLTPGSQRSK